MALVEKPNPASEPTPFEKFVTLTKKVISTPKKEIDLREADYKKERAKKKKHASS